MTDSREAILKELRIAIEVSNKMSDAPNHVYHVVECILNVNPNPEECSHEWHADQDNYCNTCIKCGARQEIYTEGTLGQNELHYLPPYDDIPINGDTPNDN